MKQYGFYIDSSKCTGCKTCQLSCKDNKDLDVGVNFRRIYEYAGGDWLKKAKFIAKVCTHTIYLLRVTIVMNLLVLKYVRQVQCINEKMDSLLSTRKFVSVVNIVRWPAHMVHLSTMKKKVT